MALIPLFIIIFVTIHGIYSDGNCKANWDDDVCSRKIGCVPYYQKAVCDGLGQRFCRCKNVYMSNKCTPSSHSDYSYDQRNEWPRLYPTCNGRYQSPINIDVNSESAKRVRFTSPLNLFEYRTIIPSAKIENDGHTVSVVINSRSLHVTGGPARNNIFYLQSLHLHFGRHNGEGSEHHINSKPYAMEIHFVHRNSKYPNMQIASKRKDGLLVLALLIAVDKGSSDNAGLSFLTKNLQRVRDPSRTNSTVVRRINLSALLPNKALSESYFTYFGSLTTPTCDEAVTWIILKQLTLISESQIKEFRLLLDGCGKPIAGNFRPLQAVNGRVIGFVR